MPKHLTRIVAFLLVPCLSVGPAFAHVLMTPMISIIPVENQADFQQQALASQPPFALDGISKNPARVSVRRGAAADGELEHLSGDNDQDKPILNITSTPQIPAALGIYIDDGLYILEDNILLAFTRQIPRGLSADPRWIPLSAESYGSDLGRLNKIDPARHEALLALPDHGLTAMNRLFSTEGNIFISRSIANQPEIVRQVLAHEKFQSLSLWESRHREDSLRRIYDLPEIKNHPEVRDFLNQLRTDPLYALLIDKGDFWHEFWAQVAWPTVPNAPTTPHLRRVALRVFDIVKKSDPDLAVSGRQIFLRLIKESTTFAQKNLLRVQASTDETINPDRRWTIRGGSDRGESTLSVLRLPKKLYLRNLQERTVLTLLLTGWSPQDIAEKLNVPLNTVIINFCYPLYKRFVVSSQQELMREAYLHGWILAPDKLKLKLQAFVDRLERMSPQAFKILYSARFGQLSRNAIHQDTGLHVKAITKHRNIIDRALRDFFGEDLEGFHMGFWLAAAILARARRVIPASRNWSLAEQAA